MAYFLVHSRAHSLYLRKDIFKDRRQAVGSVLTWRRQSCRAGRSLGPVGRPGLGRTAVSILRVTPGQGQSALDTQTS